MVACERKKNQTKNNNNNNNNNNEKRQGRLEERRKNSLPSLFLFWLRSQYFSFLAPLHHDSPATRIQHFTGRGGGGGPWSPEILAVEPGAQSLLLLGAWTIIPANWNPRVQLWSPRAPVFLCWSPGALEPYIF